MSLQNISSLSSLFRSGSVVLPNACGFNGRLGKIAHLIQRFLQLKTLILASNQSNQLTANISLSRQQGKIALFVITLLGILYTRSRATTHTPQQSETPFCQRAARVILPILSLHQQLNRPISLGMGGLHIWTALKKFYDASQSGTVAEIDYQAFRSAIAVGAFAGVLFKHPAGVLLSRVQDLMIEIDHHIEHRKKGDYPMAFKSSLSLLNNTLNLALFFHDTVDLSLASLAFQMTSELTQSVVDGWRGNFLEAFGHLAMLAAHRTQLEGLAKRANAEVIAEKLERVKKAIEVLKNTSVTDPNTSVTDPKVHEYFQRTLAKLEQGSNVPLPAFFHATEDGFNGIIIDRTIRQSQDGAAGPGVYISSNNEGDHGYGPYAFAIDARCLRGTRGRVFYGRKPREDVFFSLWCAVRKDIPISEKTVAFIDASNQNESYVKQLLEAHNLNIEVVDRDTSKVIHAIFDLSTQRRELPSFHWWKQYWDDSLPENMFSRSIMRIFRDLLLKD